MNSDSPTNDQWQPAITVKPDGTKLFVAWYDRRNAGTNNLLIQTYGTFATLPITGTNNFATNFLISTVQFLPAFTGTNTISGTYDPAYPPSVAPASTNCCGSFGGTYAGYMGDYDTAVSDNSYVYYTWGDNRNTSTNHTWYAINLTCDLSECRGRNEGEFHLAL
jgi:hypothetical protein